MRYDSTVVWAWVFVGIALGGVVMLVSYAVWLWHKASDLMFEARHLFAMTEEMAALVNQIDVDRLHRPVADHI